MQLTSSSPQYVIAQFCKKQNKTINLNSNKTLTSVSLLHLSTIYIQQTYKNNANKIKHINYELQMNTLEVFDVFNYSSDPSNVKLIACTITIRDNVGAHWNKVNITMGAAYKSWCN